MSKEVLAETPQSGRSFQHHKLWIAGIILMILFGFILLRAIVKPQPQATHTPLVRAERVNIGNAALSYAYSGDIRARYESSLAFQTSGKIMHRYVEAGSVVRAGDVLLAIDPQDIRETVNSAGAAVSAAQSQLRLAEVNWERYRKLYESGAVSKAEADRAQTGYETAKASLHQALAGYNAVGNQLDYSRLLANADGVVAEVAAEVGQVVAAGQRVLTLVQDSELEVEISVPENRLEELKNAKDFLISLWALPNVTIPGVIREIAPIADKVTRTYRVRISLADPVPQIKLGMTAKVTVIPNHGKEAVYIPLSAIYQSGDTPSVWVITDQVVHLTPVRIGRLVNNKAEIIDGLDNGCIIVTAGVHKLQEGEQVRIAGEQL